MEYSKDVKMSGASSLDTANGKASGDVAAAGKVADMGGKAPSPQAALEVGTVKVDNSEYGKK